MNPPEVVGCESMVKMGDGSDVPRVTCQGACQEGAGVVDEVGNDHSHKLLRELGDWGRACGKRLRGTSKEQPLDFGYASVPKFVDE